MAIGDRPTTSERDELADADRRPSDTSVVTAATGAANGGYAYHDPDDSGTPRCGAGGSETEFIQVTIDEAQRQNKSPCQMCDRIRD